MASTHIRGYDHQEAGTMGIRFCCRARATAGHTDIQVQDIQHIPYTVQFSISG